MEGLTEGRIVHYVLKGGRSDGQHRPAIIVRNWQPEGNPTGYVNLLVFLDGTNDGTPEYGTKIDDVTLWATSKVYSEEPKPDTWHWIERA